MKYSYYPGCSLHSVAAEYEQTTKQVCECLDIQLEELQGWTCCGASSAHSTSHLMGVALPAHNLALAEAQGADLLAPCAACFQRMAAAKHDIDQDQSLKTKVEKVLGKELTNTIKPVSILDVFNEAGLEAIASRVKKPLAGLKVASYYGCYLVKPSRYVQVDDAENPQSMDNIMEALGAEAIQWPFKTECCGNSLVFTNADIVLKLAKDILQMAVDSGANCIVTPCPLCQPNLDMRQAEVNKKYGTNFDIPVFYITELMAMAMGVELNALPLNKHYVDPTSLLKVI